MAVLTSHQLVELQRKLAANTATQTWDKAQASAAIQAVEDFIQQASTKTSIANAIETAAPGVFDGATKQMIFACWCFTAAQRMGVV